MQTHKKQELLGILHEIKCRLIENIMNASPTNDIMEVKYIELDTIIDRNFNIELDSIIELNELYLLQLLKLKEGGRANGITELAIEKEIEKLTYFQKCRLYIRKYKSYSILVALKLASTNHTPNEGYIEFYNKVDRIAGDFRLEFNMSKPSTLAEKPWINFRLFTNTVPAKDYINNKEIVQNQDMSQFDFHTCLINKYTYALPVGGSFICGGCKYQQDVKKNDIPTDDVYNNLAKLTNSIMSPFELEKYLNLVFDNKDIL